MTMDHFMEIATLSSLLVQHFLAQEVAMDLQLPLQEDQYIISTEI